MRLGALVFSLFALMVASATPAQAEDGYELWLRYHPIEAQARAPYAAAATSIVIPNDSPTAAAAIAELDRGLCGMLAKCPVHANLVHEDGAIVLGTPASSKLVAGLKLPLSKLG